MTDDNCTICMESLDKSVTCNLACSHIVCLECLVNLAEYRRSCPFCRTEIDHEAIEYEGGIPITVTSLTGRKKVFYINPLHTQVLTLMALVTLSVNPLAGHIKQVRLIRRGRQLDRRESCLFYNIRENEALMLMLRLSGD